MFMYFKASVFEKVLFYFHYLRKYDKRKDLTNRKKTRTLFYLACLFITKPCIKHSL